LVAVHEWRLGFDAREGTGNDGGVDKTFGSDLFILDSESYGVRPSDVQVIVVSLDGGWPSCQLFPCLGVQAEIEDFELGAGLVGVALEATCDFDSVGPIILGVDVGNPLLAAAVVSVNTILCGGRGYYKVVILGWVLLHLTTKLGS
jgi:hypothetical protein